MADRDAGALLLRDAGVPVDTHWIDDRDDLPRIVRAGRHIARTKRYIRNYGAEIEPAGPGRRGRDRRRPAVTAGSSWSATGSTGTRATSTPCWPADVAAAAIARAHELGARVTAHCFGEQSRGRAGRRRHRLHRARHRADRRRRGRDGARRAPRWCRHGCRSTTSRSTPSRPAPSSRRTPPTCATCTPAATPPCGRRYEAGVPIYAGTDAGGVLPHGLIGREVLALHEQVGMPPVDALAAASWRGPGLARPARSGGGRVGRPGASTTTDPRTDLRALAAPARRRPARPRRRLTSLGLGGCARSGMMARCTRRTADPLIRCVPRPPAGSDRTPTRSGPPPACEKQELHQPWQSRSS